MCLLCRALLHCNGICTLPGCNSLFLKVLHSPIELRSIQFPMLRFLQIRNIQISNMTIHTYIRKQRRRKQNRKRVREKRGVYRVLVLPLFYPNLPCPLRHNHREHSQKILYGHKTYLVSLQAEWRY